MSKLKPTPSPVSEAMILICEKCGKSFASDSNESPSRAVQQDLKAKIKDLGKKGQWRAVVTSCMDICPKDEIAIGISWSESLGGQDEFFTVNSANPEVVTPLVIDKLMNTSEI